MAEIMNWVRRHLKTALVLVGAGAGILGTVGGAGVTYYLTMQQSRADRFADNLMEEYKAVADAKRELYLAVDKFTLALATDETVNQEVVTELNTKLLDLHQRIDVFSLGLNDEDRQKLVDVKTALANIKLEAARATSKQDLQYFSGRLAQFDAAYAAARPIVERKIGTPNELLTG